MTVLKAVTTLDPNDDYVYLQKRAQQGDLGYNYQPESYDGHIVCYSLIYEDSTPVWCSIVQHRKFYKEGVVGLFRKLWSERPVAQKYGNIALDIVQQQWNKSVNAGYTVGFLATGRDVRRFFKHQVPQWEKVTNVPWYFDAKQYRLCNGDESCNQYVAWCNTTYCPFDPVN